MTIDKTPSRKASRSPPTGWAPRWLLVSATLTLCACGPNVVSVDPLRQFPQPLVTPFPADVVLFYPEEFRNFTHIEERPGERGGDWEISLGESQTQVFDIVLKSLFHSAIHSNERAIPRDSTASVLLIPSVEDFQFALPADTNIKVFEIWLKYSIAVIDKDGNEVLRWPFTAYGKTPSAFLKSNEEAINSAALVALRDAGASMISGFERERKLQDFLRRSKASISQAHSNPIPAAINRSTRED